MVIEPSASPYAGRLLDDKTPLDRKLLGQIAELQKLMTSDQFFGTLQHARFLKPYFPGNISGAARKAVATVEEQYGFESEEIETVVSVLTHLLGTGGSRIADELPRPFRKKVLPCLAERNAAKRADEEKWRQFLSDPRRAVEALNMRRQRGGDPDD